ncbi:hypothetical protein MHYP_G00072300 [Metynnis hypsauchen]
MTSVGLFRHHCEFRRAGERYRSELEREFTRKQLSGTKAGGWRSDRTGKTEKRERCMEREKEVSVELRLHSSHSDMNHYVSCDGLATCPGCIQPFVQ